MLALLLAALVTVPALSQSIASPAPAAIPAPFKATAYFPLPGEWQRKKPSELGLSDSTIAEAITWAQTQDSNWDFTKQPELFGKPIGPLPAARASTDGLIIKNGYIIAEFGDIDAVDPTYSAAKSYLSTILGLTLDRGMIRAVTDPVADYIHDGGYTDGAGTEPHNSKITWQHHATQTSEWQGEMFGKPSTFLGTEQFGKGAMKPRDIKDPGTYFEYNDVRINRFSLSLLRLWKRPLPDVLKTEIMDPIGASSTWSWKPYDNSTVGIEKPDDTLAPMPSVSGGTRWGAGLWISTLDHARFGYLILRRGNWNGKQLISREWLDQATHPHPELPGAKPDYGYLWWLNTTNAWPAAPKSSFAAIGAGNSTIWIDPEHDLVVVWRWHKQDAQAEFYKRILAAIETQK